MTPAELQTCLSRVNVTLRGHYDQRQSMLIAEYNRLKISYMLEQ
jgi:hypothetical protein